MKALFYDGSLRLLHDYARPVPSKGEALIRVLVAAVCGTDLEVGKGYKSFRGVPGHEFVGVVESVNEADPSLVGKRVTGEINCGCGLCGRCSSGMEKHCNERTTLGIDRRDGAFAEYLTLPARNLWEIPAGLPDEEAVFIEPLAAVYEVLEQCHVRPGDTVLVLGDGPVGLLVSFVVARTGARVVVWGRHEEKLRVARAQNIGTRNGDDAAYREKFDIVVEATGTAEGFNVAVDHAEARGTIIVKSTVAGRGEIDLSRLVVDEITVVGSRCGPFAPAISALARRLIDVRPLISAVFPFDRALEAFARTEEKGVIKVLLDLRQP
jgi:alcohol dehydrogenase